MEQQFNISAVLDSPNIVCECGCKTFIPAAVLKKMSALISPSGRGEIADIPVYICSKCGKIPQEYLDKANAKKILGENIEEK